MKAAFANPVEMKINGFALSTRSGFTDSIAYAAWAAFLAGQRVLVVAVGDDNIWLDRGDPRGIWLEAKGR